MNIKKEKECQLPKFYIHFLQRISNSGYLKYNLAPNCKRKLLQFRSEHFTSEETLEFIFKLILAIEEILKNEFVGQTYTEEFGAYKGLSRIVIRKFRVYYEKKQDNIIILGILFPGEK